MNIALIGTGRMGSAIEPLAIAGGHTISLRIGSGSRNLLSKEILSGVDVAIEFTRPDAAVQNLYACLEAGIPVVCGTTGWQKQSDEVLTRFSRENGTLLTASNFSIGVNMLFELNRILAGWMKDHGIYKPSVEETHHHQKFDKPSGTAITLVSDINAVHPVFNTWQLADDASADSHSIPVTAFRKEHITGEHFVRWTSPLDQLTLSHEAFSRESFALGALRAAEWIIGKTGVFTFRDVLFPDATSIQ